MESRKDPRARPRVVIVGAGFGGLTAAQSLRHAPVDVVVIDRRNHHIFQPLLYQVAMAGLSPADISAPIRGVLAHQENVSVLLGEVLSIDYDKRHVATDAGGASCEGSVTVCVPHDQGQGATCGDQGPLYDSTVCGP